MDGLLIVLTLLAALGCGMMAGVFFAFSAFVMKALARLPAEQGVAAMRAINVAAVTPASVAALFGTAAACGALVVYALFALDERFAPYLLVGSALYLVGTILPTIAYHVPRNEALATVEPYGAESHWTRYLSGRTAWNHVRAAAALAASELREARKISPLTPRLKAEHLHEPGGALRARAVERPEQLLRPVPGRKAPHRQPQDQRRHVSRA